VSIIANGGGMPPSQARIDAYYEARRAEYELKQEHIAAMKERGYHFRFGQDSPHIIWCLTCGLMVGDCDLHDASPCKQSSGSSDAHV
jgi:hypothetical protein